MADFIVAVILIAMIGGAVAYIIKAKKSGVKSVSYTHLDVYKRQIFRSPTTWQQRISC